MSKKKIFGLIASLLIVVGMLFGAMATLNNSADGNSDQTTSAPAHKASHEKQADSTSQKEQAKKRKNPTKKLANAKKTNRTATQSKQSDKQDNAGTGSEGQADSPSATKQAENQTTGKHNATKPSKSKTAPKKVTKRKASAVKSPVVTHKLISRSSGKTATLSIYGPISEGNKKIVSEKVKIHSGDMVSDVLKRVCADKHIPLSYKGANSTVYVRGINGLFEFDKGNESGWLYRVNGKFPDKSCGIYKVKNGANIQWLYTENLGRDRHAPSWK
ncbi:DUF4430 domain-containing protein [Lentilactobacillus sp. Marseille-Q4993]|uniref:DUF4430 domain-containing protein n=1 Tax=Lentilactobacillus sp. Marseille-Q4993 TaxID=3039492 RepID=UPI0024BC53E5|nr:DUF4430 domain-containing protein [Lentilactobacillus sp. Marseille-Q4993]